MKISGRKLAEPNGWCSCGSGRHNVNSNNKKNIIASFFGNRPVLSILFGGLMLTWFIRTLAQNRHPKPLKREITIIPRIDTSSLLDSATCLSNLPLLGSSIFPVHSKIGPEGGSCSYSLDDVVLESPSSSSLSSVNNNINNINNNNNDRNQTLTSLRQKVRTAVEDWGYRKKISGWIGRLQGLRVLDVGMGQGPWGAALLEFAGLEYYVGMDPDVCPPIHARTRDPRFPKRGSQSQCLKIYDTTDTKDPRVLNCTGGEQKYRAFDVTGIEMMKAYDGALALLPGTFETLHEPLKQIVFDAILINMVTEHLNQLEPVFQGLWNLMGEGCSADAMVLINHHNYYGYSGHHGYPTNAGQAKQLSGKMLELADWGHLEEDASQAQKSSLNRVRPGDLQTMLDVYFMCSCRALKTGKNERDRLTEERKRQLLERGFDETTELFVEQLVFECRRRKQPKFPFILDRLTLYHPPMDGSYKAQQLKCND